MDLFFWEIDVLWLVVEGKINKKIGIVLYLSGIIIRNYVSIIFEKLGLVNCIEFAFYASKYNFFDIL